MKKIYKNIFLLFLLSLGELHAQDLNFYGLLPSWSQTGMISKKFDYNLFSSITYSAFNRNINEVEYPSKLLQVYIQPSVIYKFRSNINFTASVTWNYQRNNPDAFYFREWRPWQQVIYTHNPLKSKLKVTHRVRLEERFIKNPGVEFRKFLRTRYQIGITAPLQGKTLDPGEFYFNAYNEWYFSLSKPRNAFYSENWTYIGIGLHLGTMGRVEVGPLYQTAVRNALKDRRNLLLLQVMWVTNFNFFKTK